MLDKNPRIMQQISLFDAKTGELLRQTTRKLGPNLEGEWSIMYDESIKSLIFSDAPPAALKTFIYLAVSQDYNGDVHSTKSDVMRKLGYESKTSRAEAFRWLESHDYIRVMKVNGQTVFRINPNVATKGKDRAKKIDLWTRQVGNKVRRSLPLD